MLANNTNAVYAPMLEILQADLASMGVKMNITQMDIAACWAA